ncbi:HAMP domain-containing sensor histidine kinase [Eubacteriaceae bacterium ES3]|nr:HAMP domain-containing sensor histidine kinase [Eubacteriaceae bacterium ES3]
MNLKRGKWPIRQRIFSQLLILMLAVFLSIFLAFNLFFENFLRSNIFDDLDATAKSISSLKFSGLEKPPEELGVEPEEEKGPDLTSFLNQSIYTEAKIFNLDNSYQITDYNIGEDYPELEMIATALMQRGDSLADSQHIHIKTETREYYVTSIIDPILSDTYMVIYSDVTDIKNLLRTINIVLGMIVSIAMLICLLVANAIANTVTKPVKKLSAFAGEMGKGIFNQHDEQFRDHEFNELMEVMNLSARQLSENEREQRTFFQNVSHELRTPIMSLRCYAEGVAYGVMKPEKSGQIMIAETDRLSDLVEDLLYLSRLENSEKPVKMQESDLRETLSICAGSIQALAEKKGLKLDFDFDNDPVLYTYNENHFYRAVNNLLSNAVRYACQTIVISCHKTDNGIEIAIKDDGPGIAEHDLSHIFERFYKGKGGKTGIGLSIVKSVVELYGGEINVLGNPKNCFRIVLPQKTLNKMNMQK